MNIKTTSIACLCTLATETPFYHHEKQPDTGDETVHVDNNVRKPVNVYNINQQIIFGDTRVCFPSAGIF